MFSWLMLIRFIKLTHQKNKYISYILEKESFKQPSLLKNYILKTICI